jgi:hypothetical protein
MYAATQLRRGEWEYSCSIERILKGIHRLLFFAEVEEAEENLSVPLY